MLFLHKDRERKFYLPLQKNLRVGMLIGSGRGDSFRYASMVTMSWLRGNIGNREAILVDKGDHCPAVQNMFRCYHLK